MTDIHVMTAAEFILPPSLVTKVDVSRLVNEAERVDNELTAAMVRSKAGVAVTTQPILSEQYVEFLRQNKLNLSDSHIRTQLIKEMRAMKDALPVVHMTFAVTADHESLQEIAAWLRTSIHPQAVIQAGLQPALVGGVYLRTPNRVHDLSLRTMIEASHDLLKKELEVLRSGK